MSGRTKHTATAAVKYKRPKKLKPKVEYDKELAEEMLAHIRSGNEISHASPNGTCFDCKKPVTGERKLCGICAARRNEKRW